MSIRSIAGLAYLCAVTVLSGATLDDKIKVFEEAVKNAPEVKGDSSPGMWPRGRPLTVDDLEMVRQHSGNDPQLEGIISRLMATHPADAVQQAGQAVILELETERKAHAQEFESKANTALAEVQDALTHAKTATDLDGILKELRALQDPQNGSFGNIATPELSNKVSQTFQFVTEWQDYLAAASAGNWQEAQNALRNILNNRQIDAPVFFPRSEILTKYEETFTGGAKSQTSAPGASAASISDGQSADEILKGIRQPKDEEEAVGRLSHVMIGTQTWDWSGLQDLVKAKDDSLAGFTVFLDFRKIMDAPVWGDDVSRITAMELLVILPRYFGTNISDPPNATETLSAYMDRLRDKANADGNLALLQRVITVQVALTSARQGESVLGTQQFLAGLSQDAAGQYTPAVISYENALKEPDRFLPVEIVGARLAAIKAAHSDEFDKGMTTFLTPALAVDPFNRLGMPITSPGFPGQFGNQRMPPMSVLPIPMVISSPQQVNTPSGNSTQPSSAK